ncbi:hypothetical protein NA57DRAFT_68703 [Rhizodiscina lignyota]|uniref:gamma-glutamylcyclotransferase n=1 Tax=Rhizodiscina lignyota TaxID=1504668 RepID=A0A9P4I805_9PEZI|nr:hypothetical protein NA57DRAFT_68703 [Rhizodiscina lignyota]
MGSSAPLEDGTIYFGFGSNLWLSQMAMRCPNSEYLGIAKLPGYKWIINDRGYANVVQTLKEADVVWGLVYRLTAADEKRLDANEGVPESYTKEMLSTELWASPMQCKAPFGGADECKVDIDKKPEKRDMLVYIDRRRTTDDYPKKEYIYRMNMGIRDAVKVGVPEGYVEKVMRKFISQEEDKEIEAFAMKQALDFQDE